MFLKSLSYALLYALQLIARQDVSNVDPYIYMEHNFRIRFFVTYTLIIILAASILRNFGVRVGYHNWRYFES